jgi:hypothetical protein
MKDAKRNWKTTVAGILTLAFAGLSIWQDPAKASDPATIGGLVTGVGLIVAKDGDKTGVAKPESK